MSLGLAQLQRATAMLEDVTLPDWADACIGALALAVIAIAKTSPEDEAERVAQIARMMARRD